MLIRKLNDEQAACIFGTYTPSVAAIEPSFNSTKQPVCDFDFDAIDLAVRTQRDTLSVSWKLLGCGASKDVYALNNNWVLKVCNSDWQQIEPEVKVWQNATPKERYHLAPIAHYAPDYQWSIMRRAAPFRYTFAFELESAINQLRSTARKHNFEGDLFECNIGMIGRRCVAIDYGFNGGRPS